MSTSNRIGLAGVAVFAVLVVVVAMWSGDQPDNPPSRAPAAGNEYVDEYGGADQVYADIASETDCGSLQETFDQAATNNDGAEPGTAEHRWTTGYMVAANERMEAIGCYE